MIPSTIVRGVMTPPVSLVWWLAASPSTRQARDGDRRVLAGERAEEREQVRFLAGGEGQRADVARHAWTAHVAAAIVELDGRLEARLGAVVHVRSAPGDAAQGRRLERVLHEGQPGEMGAAADVGALHTDVVEAAVGERPALVAARAPRLAVEHHESALGALGDGSLVAGHPAVEGRLRGD